MKSKFVLILAIILLLISAIALGVLLNQPQAPSVAVGEGKVLANVVVGPAAAPASVTGKVVMNVLPSS